MDLEQRVQMLEQELQILKNQVQATLLDIQAQLLTNAHPALRADEPDSVAPAAPKVSTFSVSAQPQSAAPEAGGDEGTPLVRRVSLNDMNGSGGGAVPSPAPRVAAPPAPSLTRANAPQPQPAEQTLTDWSTLEDLEEWACKKVDKIGLSRTRELIWMYADKGRFDPHMRDTLLEFVSLYAADHQDPVSQARTRRPAASNGKSDPGNRTATARGGRPSSAPTRQTQPRSASAAPRSQPQNAYSANGGQARRPEPPPPPALEPASRRKAKSRDPEPPPVEEKKEDNASSSMILKLIAGVHNAGAGVKWKGRNDG